MPNASFEPLGWAKRRACGRMGVTYTGVVTDGALVSSEDVGAMPT
jgi:hypothetical protein